MTENQKEALKYKDYPENSGGKAIYDRYFLPFKKYLEKYYSDSEYEEWERWKKKYIESAFDENQHDEFIKNWGYVDKKYHHFNTQYQVYSQLKNDERLPEEVKKFIGFLAGVGEGFFNKYHITVEQWFNMKNWHNPNLPENEEGHTINEILSYPYGINYFKVLLIQMPYWKR